MIMRAKSQPTELVKIEPPSEDTPSQPELSSWALVELFGHQRIVGYLSQQSFGTGVLFRVDVPDLTKDGKVVRQGFTRYFGLGTIFSITPIDEATVRRMLPAIDGTPGDARPLSLASFNRDPDDGY
jgi:hypothetical protein